MVAKCSAITKAGSRCTAPVLADSSYCYLHDPATAGSRLDAARRGGRARSNQARAAKQILPAMTAEELAGWLSLIFTRVMTGVTSPKIGSACAQLARTMLVVQESAVLEERLAELEQRAGIRRLG